VAVIEWADRLGPLFPGACLKAELFFKSDSKRRLRFSAQGRRAKELLGNIFNYHENTGH